VSKAIGPHIGKQQSENIDKTPNHGDDDISMKEHKSPLADFKATTESEIHIPVVYRSVILLS
jgi:hypothetical protein